jgi:hypothetical protein
VHVRPKPDRCESPLSCRCAHALSRPVYPVERGHRAILDCARWDVEKFFRKSVVASQSVRLWISFCSEVSLFDLEAVPARPFLRLVMLFPQATPGERIDSASRYDRSSDCGGQYLAGMSPIAKKHWGPRK